MKQVGCEDLSLSFQPALPRPGGPGGQAGVGGCGESRSGGQAWASRAVHRPPDSKGSHLPGPTAAPAPPGRRGGGPFGASPLEAAQTPSPRARPPLRTLSQLPQARAHRASPGNSALRALCLELPVFAVFGLCSLPWRIRAPKPPHPPQWRGWIPGQGWSPHSTERVRDRPPHPAS